MESKDVNPASGKSRRNYKVAPVMRAEHAEGLITRTIEQQTAKVPSEVFLASSLAAMGASLICELRGSVRLSRFFGMWVGPLLMMGIYNKLVKIAGPS